MLLGQHVAFTFDYQIANVVKIVHVDHRQKVPRTLLIAALTSWNSASGYFARMRLLSSSAASFTRLYDAHRIVIAVPPLLNDSLHKAFGSTKCPRGIDLRHSSHLVVTPNPHAIAIEEGITQRRLITVSSVDELPAELRRNKIPRNDPPTSIALALS
jgi:hypothetical protein